jgi:DNA-binding NtrC family response regulator
VKAVVVGRDWPRELEDSLGRDGYSVDHVDELASVPALLAGGETQALFVSDRPLAASDLLMLRRVRESAPRVAIVVVATSPTRPDLSRALENGATAFLSWPASADALRQAIQSGRA